MATKQEIKINTIRAVFRLLDRYNAVIIGSDGINEAVNNIRRNDPMERLTPTEEQRFIYERLSPHVTMTTTWNIRSDADA